MAAEGEFEFDMEGSLPGGSFSRLLLSDDAVEEDEKQSESRASPFGCYYSPVFTSPRASSSSSSSLFSPDTPKMLCFGDFYKDDEMGGSLITSQTVSSSPVSKSSSNASITSFPTISNSNNKKRNQSSEKEISGAGDQNRPKKIRPKAGSNGSRSAPGHAKAKKREKLGDRVAALQQLVSPYGKTDTASVLHETMGYIKFLQDQVKVLCSPYLQCVLPSPTGNGDKVNKDIYTEDLKSKGLCLVPVNGITDMATPKTGADFWSPVTMNNTPATGYSLVSNQ
ncbi:hypothetical protein V2J09_016744 [Rumex salicifolius]